MAGINLLPWRAERRKQKRQEFFSIAALALLFTVGVLMLIHFRISRMIEYQNQRNQYLQSEVALLDKKIKEIQDLEAKKKRLVAKMEVIQQLQHNRPEAVHLFDELARTLPEGIVLLDLAQTDNLLVINGMAQSNARISGYMRNLESSPWLQDPILNVIEAKKENKEQKEGAKFTLQVKQANEKKEAPGGKPS
jgi:type IV pilus assembly protein PilN